MASVNALQMEIWRCVQPFTMTSFERVAAAVGAVEHVVAGGVAGDIVECGVWRGGSMMAMALALLRCGDSSRMLFLYDTFAGMTQPAARDVRFDGAPACDLLASSPRDADVWGIAPIDEVRRNLASTRYPAERIRFVSGPVEQTIPRVVPDTIAILRLDTDWYSSTWHELVHLYPRVSVRGVVIIDDYGHWRGSREATDEYFAFDGAPCLRPIDYTGVVAVKNREMKR